MKKIAKFNVIRYSDRIQLWIGAGFTDFSVETARNVDNLRSEVRKTLVSRGRPFTQEDLNSIVKEISLSAYCL